MVKGFVIQTGSIAARRFTRRTVAASAALALIAVQKGASLVRVHDVAETADALAVAARVAAAEDDAGR